MSLPVTVAHEGAKPVVVQTEHGRKEGEGEEEGETMATVGGACRETRKGRGCSVAPLHSPCCVEVLGNAEQEAKIELKGFWKLLQKLSTEIEKSTSTPAIRVTIRHREDFRKKWEVLTISTKWVHVFPPT